jgi:hypothetical protein
MGRLTITLVPDASGVVRLTAAYWTDSASGHLEMTGANADLQNHLESIRASLLGWPTEALPTPEKAEGKVK